MAISDNIARAEKSYATDHDAQRPILSIEASDADFAHLSMALKDAGVTNPFWRYADSGAVAAALGTAEGCAEMQLAAFALLDLDMPGADGRALLQLFREREHKLPIIVLSSSSHSEDVAFCYRSGANGYLVKPLKYDQWKDMMATVAAYWLHVAILPSGRPPLQLKRHVTAHRSGHG